jgi:hypothetical protein
MPVLHLWSRNSAGGADRAAGWVSTACYVSASAVEQRLSRREDDAAPDGRDDGYVSASVTEARRSSGGMSMAMTKSLLVAR